MERAEDESAVRCGNVLPTEQFRSSQPWVSQISAQAIDQVRNIVQSKGKDAGRPRTKNRGDDALSLTILQQQMDELEDRFSLQLQRLQSRTERLRQAETQQWEERVGISEFSQRRLAELSKSVEVLEDQLQLQIDRLDQMVGSLSTWQKQIGDDMKEHYSSVNHLAENISRSLQEETAEAAGSRLLVRNHELILSRIQEALGMPSEIDEHCRNNSEEQVSHGSPPSAALVNDFSETGNLDLDRMAWAFPEHKSSILDRIEAQEGRLRNLRTHTEASNSQIVEIQEQISTMRGVWTQEVLEEVEQRVFTQDHHLQSLKELLTTTSFRVDDLAAALLKVCEHIPTEPTDPQCVSERANSMDQQNFKSGSPRESS